MGESKVEALLNISQVNFARAEKRFEAGEYDSAVFHASMAVESAANTLILKLGGTEARDHRAITGLAAVVRRKRPDWLAEEDCTQLIERGKEIQREVVYTRYPLKMGGRWTTPMEYYTREKTEKIIDDARVVVEAIKKYIRRIAT